MPEGGLERPASCLLSSTRVFSTTGRCLLSGIEKYPMMEGCLVEVVRPAGPGQFVVAMIGTDARVSVHATKMLLVVVTAEER